jgi:hypothetical protein
MQQQTPFSSRNIRSARQQHHQTYLDARRLPGLQHGRSRWAMRYHISYLGAPFVPLALASTTARISQQVHPLGAINNGAKPDKTSTIWIAMPEQCWEVRSIRPCRSVVMFDFHYVALRLPFSLTERSRVDCSMECFSGPASAACERTCFIYHVEGCNQHHALRTYN